MRLGRLGTAALDLVFPPRCPMTDDPVTRHGAFSGRAWAQAQMIAAPLCEACGLPFSLNDPAAPLCAACAAPDRFAGALTGRGRLDRVRSALRYDDESAPVVLSLKYADRHDAVPALCRLLALTGDELLRDGATLVPVPLHPTRLRERRFNQAAVLAGGVARLTRSPHAPRLLIRKRPTPKQKGMSPAARARNVSGAFALRRGESAEGGRFVLIDDVLTSGATLVACARALRRAGAAEVSALTLARVIRG
ncbi:ComF family protein [Parvularcula oceani]|uniref:ComF family protein n=1 Tax=Parvularcula oceani TaxID=1247963 RepID=UPI0005669CB9|nr:double zinc ribbon domain-containing protein [Parvularcula oceani]